MLDRFLEICLEAEAPEVVVLCTPKFRSTSKNKVKVNRILLEAAESTMLLSLEGSNRSFLQLFTLL